MEAAGAVLSAPNQTIRTYHKLLECMLPNLL